MFVRAGEYGAMQSKAASTGCPSFDELLMDNGVPYNSVLLLQEDWPRSSVNYASLICKSFLAEGVLKREKCLLVVNGGDGVNGDFMKSLPEHLESNDSQSSDKDNKDFDEKLTIAWRYKNLQHGVDKSNTKSSLFSFGGRMSETIALKYIDVCGYSQSLDFKPYKRVVVIGFGSPDFEGDFDLIIKLKQCQAACVITSPFHCVDNEKNTKMCHLCDCVIRVERSRAVKDVECFLNIVKPFTLLKQYLPDTLSLHIKLDHRKRLLVSPFHLPPDLGGTDKPGSCSTVENAF